jgi:predicted metalloprotease with PDZ domain
MAANWNALIKMATGGRNSLDDVMRDMFDEAQKQGRRELNVAVINEHIRRYLGQDVISHISNYIEQGQTILPASNALGPCAMMGAIGVASFELGFDLDALVSKKIIANVKRESAAYRAGLRDGQAVARRKPIYLGDPDKEIEITVKEGEQEKTIRFYPASPNRTRVPQFRLRPGLNDQQKAGCI